MGGADKALEIAKSLVKLVAQDGTVAEPVLDVDDCDGPNAIQGGTNFASFGMRRYVDVPNPADGPQATIPDGHWEVTVTVQARYIKFDEDV